jgi:hypothetical protein
MPKIGEKVFDVRTLERAFHRGEIKPSEYEKYLKSLPDESENVTETRPGDPEPDVPPPPSNT